MLFIGAVVFAAYCLKKDNNLSTSQEQGTMAQTSSVVLDDDHYLYNTEASTVTDTLKQK